MTEMVNPFQSSIAFHKKKAVQPAITCSKLRMEALEQSVKSVQS